MKTETWLKLIQEVEVRSSEITIWLVSLLGLHWRAWAKPHQRACYHFLNSAYFPKRRRCPRNLNVGLGAGETVGFLLLYSRIPRKWKKKFKNLKRRRQWWTTKLSFSPQFTNLMCHFSCQGRRRMKCACDSNESYHVKYVIRRHKK